MMEDDVTVDPIGRTIVDFRRLTDAEVTDMGWDGMVSRFDCPMALVLDNGSLLVPMRDEEGNGPGVLDVGTAEGRHFLVFPPAEVESA